MPRQRPDLVLHDFDNDLRQSLGLAVAAQQWLLPASGLRRPKFTLVHHDMLVESAFLRSYLAWESFLEESFVLYLLGKRPPRGRAPRRIALPSTRDHAIELVLPEGRRYADWDNPEFVLNQAQRFFLRGEPYEGALRISLNLFRDLQVIRNAMVHRSYSSRGKFEKLVRNELGALPPNLGVGRFLGTTKPNSNPPVSFLEHYLSRIMRSAHQIIPI